MNSAMPARSFDDLALAVAAAEDRRTHDRLKLLKTMYIFALDSDSTDQIATAVDISRRGLYFTVRAREHKVGTEIKVTIPSLGFEAVCKIVRTEELPSGEIGVGCLVIGW